MKLAALILLLVSSALAGEFAVLSSGQRLYVECHERAGGKMILYSKTGSTELDASWVTGFEPEEHVQAPAAPPRVPAAPAPTAAPAALVSAAAEKHGIPEKLLHSVVAAESGYRPNAVSPKGAIGLMQLMPDTARQYGADPANPAQNVEAGTAYLGDLLQKYHGDVAAALAAYNAGPGAVAKYNNSVPPYPETRAYVGRVIQNWQRRAASARPLATPQPAGNTAGQSSPPE